MTDTTQSIRLLNDRFRRGDPSVPGKIVLSTGIQALLEEKGKQTELVYLVQSYDRFNEINDPYGEHDFGSFSLDGYSCFWKIDYFAPDFIHGAEDPSSSLSTMRVLTIMLAEEY